MATKRAWQGGGCCLAGSQSPHLHSVTIPISGVSAAEGRRSLVCDCFCLLPVGPFPHFCGAARQQGSKVKTAHSSWDQHPHSGRGSPVSIGVVILPMVEMRQGAATPGHGLVASCGTTHATNSHATHTCPRERCRLGSRSRLHTLDHPEQEVHSSLVASSPGLKTQVLLQLGIKETVVRLHRGYCSAIKRNELPTHVDGCPERFAEWKMQK